MRKLLLILAGVSLIVGSMTLSARADDVVVTVQSLLREMTDYDSVARWPNPEYVCRQASSYDRASKTAADLKGWFANNDQNQFIRTEIVQGRSEKVMMDVEGPGAIVRFWLTCGENKRGKIRIYLDGADAPTITVPAFDFLNNQALPAGSPLLTSHPGYAPNGRGGNTLFLPIPYAKHCKITWEEDDPSVRVARYYLINYRTYPISTKVETFALGNLELSGLTLAICADVNTTLAKPLPVANVKEFSRDEVLESGAKMELALPPGPAAIRQLEVRPDSTDAQALRSLVLQVSFDGQETIWCPVSDFFGSGVGLNVLRSWYRTAAEDGTLRCRWVMPYKESARVTLCNFGKTPVSVKLLAKIGDWKWDERSMHFHTNWRQQFPIATRPFSDWNFITTNGQGVYVGDTLCVMNPVTAWWGEGDEKIWVDGELFPSHFGTGTEDYYCYSWSDPRKFQTPFANQVRCDGPGNKGQTVVTRTRSLDAIPFTKSLKFDLEIWHWADCKVAYAATTYWYGLPGATSNRGPESEEAARPIPTIPPPYQIAGATECEKLRVIAKSPKVATEVQSGVLSEGEWSDDAQLFVRGNQAGDYIELQFPAKESGGRKLTLYATKSWDYGILRFSVNGRPAGKDYDAYSPRVILSGPIELGVFEPQDGKFMLRVEVVGANPESKNSKSYFGLDAITASAP